MILIPYPNAANNHQKSNALELSNDCAAKLLEQHEMDKKLIPTIFNLLGRFKSAHGRILHNTWERGPTGKNLEVEPLQNWLEGMLGIHDVLIANNTFYGMSKSPVHVFGAVDVRQVNNKYIE